MNGPSPTLMTSSARAASTPHASNTASRILVAIHSSSFSLVVAIRRPRRDLAVDPLLQLDDERAKHGKRDEIGEDFLGFHHLPGLHQQVAHAALARAPDHLGCDHEDYGDAHAEVQAGEDAGN